MTAAVYAPHGPIALADCSLACLGRGLDERGTPFLGLARSDDGGTSWELIWRHTLADVTLAETADGRLVVSEDRGRSWHHRSTVFVSDRERGVEVAGEPSITERDAGWGLHKAIKVREIRATPRAVAPTDSLPSARRDPGSLPRHVGRLAAVSTRKSLSSHGSPRPRYHGL